MKSVDSNKVWPSDLGKIVEEIVKQSMIEIEFLIMNSDKINKLSDGAVNLKNIDSFRDAITIVYMAEQNNGILKRANLSLIFKLLDDGVIFHSFFYFFILLFV